MIALRRTGTEKRNARFHNNLGFTIVEMLIAFSVFAILAVAITPVFKQGNDFWQAAESEAELRQSLNSALQVISRELRQAEPGSISVGANPVVAYTANGQTRALYIVPNPGRPEARHIEFSDGSAVTPSLLVNILDFRVSEDGFGYSISITGRYAGINNIRTENKELTVATRVFPRSEP